MRNQRNRHSKPPLPIDYKRNLTNMHRKELTAQNSHLAPPHSCVTGTS
jgi:hypothetical protein